MLANPKPDINTDYPKLGFEVLGSIAGLMKEWQERAEAGDPEALSLLQALESRLSGVLDFETAEDFQLEPELRRQLFSSAVPQCLQGSAFSAVLPFSTESLYYNEAFGKLLRDDGSMNMELDFELINRVRLASAFKLILRDCYGCLELPDNDRLKFTQINGPLKKYYEFEMHTEYMVAEFLGEKLPDLVADPGEEGFDDEGSGAHWFAHFAPSDFRIRGFGVLEAHENTRSECQTRLMNQLLHRQAYTDRLRLDDIAQDLRNLLGLCHLEMGIGLPDESELLLFRSSRKHETDSPTGDWSSWVRQRMNNCPIGTGLEGATLLKSREALMENWGKFSDWFSPECERFLLLPLFGDREKKGVTILASQTPGAFAKFTKQLLQPLVGFFERAAESALEDWHTLLDSSILQDFTAIHSSVEWRFRESIKERLYTNQPAAEHSILFRSVYPIFASSDIRSSSHFRQVSIQKDLVSQLEETRALLLKAKEQLGFHYLDQLAFHCSSLRQQLEEHGSPSDEVEITDFLTKTAFDVLKTLAESNLLTSDLRQALRDGEPKIRELKQHSEAYDHSVIRIREELAELVLAEQEKIQKHYPHYFEMQKTDGLEYTAYIGGSIADDEKFPYFMLKNLRLWQLKLTCLLARRSEEIKPELALPLETAHLIVLQDKPLSIRFQQDEKQFAVDGAYDMRYAVLKSRLDKALVLDSDERLTQPGYIAIVYSQPGEVVDFYSFVPHLAAQGFLEERIENLAVESQPGAQGLRAIRVKVKMGNDSAGGVNNSTQ